jgi:hypothetical protein
MNNDRSKRIRDYLAQRTADDLDHSPIPKQVPIESPFGESLSQESLPIPTEVSPADIVQAESATPSREQRVNDLLQTLRTRSNSTTSAQPDLMATLRSRSESVPTEQPQPDLLSSLRAQSESIPVEPPQSSTPSPQPRSITKQSPPPEQPDLADSEPYEAPGFQDNGMLEGLQRGAREDKLYSNLGKAFNTIGSAIGNQKVDQSFFEGLDKQADQPVNDLLARRKASVEEIALKDSQSQRDPNSPENIAFREFIKVKLPGLSASPKFGQLTIANPALSKVVDLYMKSEDRAASLEAARLAKEASMAQTKAYQDQSLELKRQGLEVQKDAKFGPQGTHARFTSGKTMDLAKELAPAQAAATALDNLETTLGFSLDDVEEINGNIMVKGKEANIPGVAAIPGYGPAAFPGSKGQRIKSDIAAILNDQIKMTAGSAVTTPEMARIRDEFLSGAYTTDAQLLYALKRFKSELDAGMSNRIAAYKTTPGLVEKYVAEGGRISTQRPQQQTQQNEVPPGMKLQKNKKTGETRLVPIQ